MAKQNDITYNKTNKILRKVKKFLELKIKDAMDKRSWDVPLIEIDSGILDVLAILSTNDHVWVVENRENKKILGVITEHDFVDAIPPPKSSTYFGVPSRKDLGISLFENIEHLMIHEPLTCTPNDKVKDVLQKIKTYNIRRLPVIDTETRAILGEVTAHQLIRKYYNSIKSHFKLRISK